VEARSDTFVICRLSDVSWLLSGDTLSERVILAAVNFASFFLFLVRGGALLDARNTIAVVVVVVVVVVVSVSIGVSVSADVGVGIVFVVVFVVAAVAVAVDVVAVDVVAFFLSALLITGRGGGGEFVDYLSAFRW
jgi:hypothetical protein